MSVVTILLLLAFVCFVLAAFNVAVRKVSLLALGLAFLTLALLVGGLGGAPRLRLSRAASSPLPSSSPPN